MPAPDTFKYRLFQLMEAGHADSAKAVVCDWAMILLIVANVAAVVASFVFAVVTALQLPAQQLPWGESNAVPNSNSTDVLPLLEIIG